jgi:preprotein translocase subunit SecE
MDSNNSKVITVCFMIAGILTGVVASILIGTLSTVTTGGFSRFIGQDLVRHGVPVAVGVVAFLVLQFNKQSVAWGDDVVSEVRRIVWPSRKDTTSMTIVVCIMLVISGIILGLMDVVSGSLIDWLLTRGFAGLFT